MTGTRFFLAIMVMVQPFAPLPAAPIPKPKANHHATPEASFRAWAAAAKRKDYKAYLACLTPQAQAFTAGNMMRLAAFSLTVKDEHAKHLLKVMRKYRVGQELIDRAMKESLNISGGREEYHRVYKGLVATIDDKAGFATDVFEAMAKGSTMKGFMHDGTVKKVVVKGRFAELTVEVRSGDTTATQWVPCERGPGGWKVADLPRAWSLRPEK